MAIGYVLYNPQAGNGKEDAALLQLTFPDDLQYFDMTRITNYGAFLSGLTEDDYLVIVGGDGTLNRFANATADMDIPQKILYYPNGTGNDFATDLGKAALKSAFPVTQYLKKLPWVEVKGKKYRFLNAVGFGIDGYCCEEGDRLRRISSKKVNYTAIAIKGLLFRFQARNATVTVDGKSYSYKKVWIAPTMHGKYYGGGMMAAPAQNRLSESLSLIVFHGAGRFRTLCVFPSIFKGEHIKYNKMVSVHTGQEITVEFDRPTPLQIDGETILGVTRYTAGVAEKDHKEIPQYA